MSCYLHLLEQVNNNEIALGDKMRVTKKQTVYIFSDRQSKTLEIQEINSDADQE